MCDLRSKNEDSFGGASIFLHVHYTLNRKGLVEQSGLTLGSLLLFTQPLLGVGAVPLGTMFSCFPSVESIRGGGGMGTSKVRPPA